jgi:hypothetical protein
MVAQHEFLGGMKFQVLQPRMAEYHIGFDPATAYPL